jgi:hypothetical protein
VEKPAILQDLLSSPDQTIKHKGVSMEKDTKNELYAWSFVIALGVMVFTGCYYWMAATCDSRWAESGLEHKWSVTALCLIKIGDRWIPEKNYACDRESCHE